MAFEQQVNQWFADNPNSTPQQLADAVKAAGGLEANVGLADTLGARLGIGANEVTEAYGRLTAAPAATVTPVATAPSYWSGTSSGVASTATPDYSNATPAYMGIAASPQNTAPTASPTNTASNSTIDFANATPAYMGIAKSTLTPSVVPPITSPIQQAVDRWKADNPNGTPQQIANAIAAAGGLTPEIAQAVANAYGTNAAEITAGYEKWNPYSQMATMYDNKDYTGINSLLGQSGLTSAQVQQNYGLTNEQMNQARDLGINLNYTTPEIQSLVQSTLGSKTLDPWEQVNKIFETGQKYGFGEKELADIYGKDALSSYLNTYKTGINDYINKALATDPTKTTFDEIGQIHQAATKYGLTPDEIAKYGGMDPKTAQSYFDMYNQGLGTIVANMADPKTNDLTKTQTALALQQKYGTTDAEIAKASNGKYTEKDVKAYLDPVRNVPTNLQKLFDDPNASAADITKFINEAKADSRAAGIYGAALDKVAANTPSLYLRDAVNGNNADESAKKFLAAAKATPELATQYAPQIAALEKVMQVTERARNKDFGGKLPDYAVQMFLGLDKKTQSDIPKQLTTTTVPAHTETRSASDDSGNYTYDVNIPAKTTVKTPGGFTQETDEEGNVLGYSKKVSSDDFKGLYAHYDANGTLTGYDDRSSRVHVSDPQYYYAKFDANGNATPGTGANRSGGFVKNTLQDVASLGPVGQIALMAATGGLGSLAAGALASSLGPIAAQMVGSGLVGGVMSNVAGGDFGKGFVAGGAGAGASALANGVMPTGGFNTGSPMVDSYLAKALPNAAGAITSAGFSGADMGNAGLYSLLNTGVNMGTNTLLKDSPIGTLPASAQPYATGILSNVISSALTNQNPNVQNAIMRTLGQQAMQAGKAAIKP